MSLKGIFQGIKIIDWIIDRVDQVSKWMKGYFRDKQEKKIDKYIDELDIANLKRLQLRINEEREKRRNKS